MYIVPLIREYLALPVDIAASTNPKSSTGRLDVFTRVIADSRRVALIVSKAAIDGPLYAEISPKTFPVHGARRVALVANPLSAG